MNELEAMKAMLDGHAVARACGLVRRWIEDGRLTSPAHKDGSTNACPSIERADDWEIVPKEPTLLELAKKIWPGATGISSGSASRSASQSFGNTDVTWVEHGGPYTLCISVHGNGAEQTRNRLRIALEAIIEAEGLDK